MAVNEYEPERLFRLYAPDECGEDGYPFVWHRGEQSPPEEQTGLPGDGPIIDAAVKDLVRENAMNRCLRCLHPYTKGDGQWSPCSRECTHMGPVRMRELAGGDLAEWFEHDLNRYAATAGETITDEGPNGLQDRFEVQAEWRILTVHHLLTGPEGKRNLRWWNLVSLCQRCHLTVQRRVDLRRIYPWPHTEWFRPYAAGWYAFAYLGEHLSRAETMERLDELLALEGIQTGGVE